MEVQSIFDALPIRQFAYAFCEKNYEKSYEQYLQDNLAVRQVLAKRQFDLDDFTFSLRQACLAQKELVKQESFFKRNRFRFTMTQAAVTYALPMLLALEEENHALTGAFISVWGEVFGDSLQAASHETIAKSFHPNFMGMANPFKGE